MRTLMFVAAAAALLHVPTTVDAQDFRVIAHPAVPTSEIKSAEITSIFLKKSAKFADGTAATPIDQAKGSPLRAAFSRDVLGRPALSVETYWQQQIFGGGELPPVIKASDDEVVAMVRATPGAIGYVSSAANVTGVKVITVK